jgi:hypothetical protein
MACICSAALFISSSPELEQPASSGLFFLNGAIHFASLPSSVHLLRFCQFSVWAQHLPFPDFFDGENLLVSRAVSSSHKVTISPGPNLHGPIPLTFAGSLFQLNENMGAME